MRKTMKILHVITSLRTGGAEKLMVDLLPRLVQPGVEVELAVFDGTRTVFYAMLEQRGIKIHPFTIGGSVYSSRHILRLKKLMRSFDIVHTHNTAAQLFASMAAAMMRRPPILVTTEHSTSNRRRGNRLMQVADRWMYRKYNAVVAITRQVADALTEHIGCNIVKIVLIHNGIETRLFQDNGNKIQHKNGTRDIVMVAAFRPPKAQPTLIRAMKLLPNNFKLHLVGTGDLLEDNRKLVSDLGLDGRVVFEGVRTDIPAVLHSADYVVMSTHYEGLPLSVLEAMCSGRPLIASDVPGVNDLVGGAALMFPDGDANALASHIIDLENNPELRKQVIEKCVERGLKYDISLMADAYMQLYKELAQQ